MNVPQYAIQAAAIKISPTILFMIYSNESTDSFQRILSSPSPPINFKVEVDRVNSI